MGLEALSTTVRSVALFTAILAFVHVVIVFARDGQVMIVQNRCAQPLVSTVEIVLCQAPARALGGGPGSTVRRRCALRQETTNSLCQRHFVFDGFRRFFEPPHCRTT